MHFVIRQGMRLLSEALSPPAPHEILQGERLFRPFLRQQRAWMRHFYPGDTLEKHRPSWQYLQKYLSPLIQASGSRWHCEGIMRLGLHSQDAPDFSEFARRFHGESNGFSIHPVKGEIEPVTYFSLIAQKKFPCIPEMRHNDSLFCGSEPDFWHEAIGHLAPLCFPEVQDFYLSVADKILSSSGTPRYERNLAIAWTLSEYGFLREGDSPKMFGAALVSSHLAHMRYLHNYLCVEPASAKVILESGFYEADRAIARDEAGRQRFFCMDTLNIDALLD
ncbi:phenylalanine-4-hydroxylase [Legionella geestiana]|uniref:Phenylalanine-4-hydroxylase n=1 Tax=Legionella geestiana TaxID=45065 RepID=A0A0W0U6Y1_9GAMM|nr:hypothetical protein [Legionella geestiana]KTD03796.1 phenylalanine-4-hydroxylase [Legionella geestiana]QBS11918.1 hypothetical protein E4T54_03685 [Legionella geestiana]QDQ40469.1 hypothetical protein E3226_008740 [Legionella geestiana]STX53369.1 phenylalanine-4-hydroxylase [Legionella geestiana]